ncbi:MAG: Slp family lipoprotein [Paraglaciecola sp.]|uniref:Slp family lipoprotein n=1 Tax=Paraglaciecola sp. TaxID=1920173 RepID=UPI00329695F4
MNTRICALLSAIFLAGCSTFPEKLQLDDTTQLVIYEDAASKAEESKGKMIRWGGAIAKVENKPDSTVFEMVYYPLNGYGRPVSGEESMGRYRVHVNGFMDPMVYKVGRLMTFTAELNGVEKGLVGEHEYVFPTANAKSYYLWKNVQRIDVSSVHVWPYQYWYGHYPRPYSRTLYIRGTSGNKGHGVKVSRPSGATTYPKPIKTQGDKK